MHSIIPLAFLNAGKWVLNMSKSNRNLTPNILYANGNDSNHALIQHTLALNKTEAMG